MHAAVSALIADIGTVVIGKERQVRLALTCLLGGGHLLLEDLPGMGKTTLAHALARVTGLSFGRVQFTSDLLPADVVGVSVFDRNSAEFRFQPGPIFTELLLADEINRSTPKTQSALLEAMAEGQVTVDGVSHPLTRPFWVIATQNPQYQSGTYPLPESQLDRFMMRLQLGYPERDAELQLLRGADVGQRLAALRPRLNAEKVLVLQKMASAVAVSEGLLDYVQRLLQASRHHPAIVCGLSPRAGVALLSAARTWALLAGRRYVTPDDVQAVLPAVAGHRLQGADGSAAAGERLATLLLREVDVLHDQ